MGLSNFDSRVTRLFLEAGMQEVDGTEELFYTGENKNVIASGSTEMNFGFKRTNQTVYGSRRVVFQQMKILEMFKNISPVVYCYTPRSSLEVVDALIARYGVPLKREWFREEAIPTEVGNSPGFKIHLWLNNTLFTYGSREIKEALEVQVNQANVDIGDIFKKNVLAAPKMPYVIRQGYTNIDLLSYGKDFTPNTIERFKLLRAIENSLDLYHHETPHAERSANLVELLQDRLGFKVTVEADVDKALCLLRGTFVYNGPTVGFNGANTWYDNILVFDTITDPVDSAARDYRGRAYVHYNNMS